MDAKGPVVRQGRLLTPLDMTNCQYLTPWDENGLSLEYYRKGLKLISFLMQCCYQYKAQDFDVGDMILSCILYVESSFWLNIE